jgi:hypothetical protein
VKSNLQASKPIRRPLSFGVVGSQHLAPSGHVPSSIVLDYILAFRSSVGAGPDCFSCISFRDPSAKSMDLFEISITLLVLLAMLPLFNESF